MDRLDDFDDFLLDLGVTFLGESDLPLDLDLAEVFLGVVPGVSSSVDATLVIDISDPSESLLYSSNFLDCDLDDFVELDDLVVLFFFDLLFEVDFGDLLDAEADASAFLLLDLDLAVDAANNWELLKSPRLTSSRRGVDGLEGALFLIDFLLLETGDKSGDPELFNPSICTSRLLDVDPFDAEDFFSGDAETDSLFLGLCRDLEFDLLPDFFEELTTTRLRFWAGGVIGVTTLKETSKSSPAACLTLERFLVNLADCFGESLGLLFGVVLALGAGDLLCLLSDLDGDLLGEIDFLLDLLARLEREDKSETSFLESNDIFEDLLLVVVDVCFFNDEALCAFRILRLGGGDSVSSSSIEVDLTISTISRTDRAADCKGDFLAGPPNMEDRLLRVLTPGGEKTVGILKTLLPFTALEADL